MGGCDMGGCVWECGVIWEGVIWEVVIWEGVIGCDRSDGDADEFDLCTSLNAGI